MCFNLIKEKRILLNAIQKYTLQYRLEDRVIAITSMRLPDDLLLQLSDLAEATGRTKTFLTIQALRNFIDQEAWQIAEIKKAWLKKILETLLLKKSLKP